MTIHKTLFLFSIGDRYKSVFTEENPHRSFKDEIIECIREAVGRISLMVKTKTASIVISIKELVQNIVEIK